MIVCCSRAKYLCWLDQAAHVIGLKLPWLCDWHDRYITGEA